MVSHTPRPKHHQQNFQTVHRIYTVHKYNSIWVEAYIDHCACVVNLTLPLSLSLNKTFHRWPTEQSRTQESRTQLSSTLLYTVDSGPGLSNRRPCTVPQDCCSPEITVTLDSLSSGKLSNRRPCTVPLDCCSTEITGMLDSQSAESTNQRTS